MTETTAHTFTDRDEWLEWRRGGIGGSDVAGILGLSTWSSPWSVWADKAQLLPPQDDNDYMEFGRRAESMISGYFHDRTGLYVYGEQTCYEHPLNAVHRCTLDGLVGDSPGWTDDAVLGGLEAKTAPASPRRWDEIPAGYQAQGQWQIHVRALERVFFAVLHGKHFEFYELERDDADIQLIIERVDAFWTDHVLTGTPPPTDSSEATARALAAVYPDSQPDMGVEIDLTLLDELEEAKARAKEAKDAETAASNAVKAALGDAEVGTVDGQRRISWKSQHRDAYVVEASDFRVLRSHKPKEKVA